MDKYTALADHLRASPEAVIRLSFAQVEEIIGSHLPDSARQHHAWWSNSRTDDSHTWAHQWLRAGWEKVTVSFTEQWVEFRCIETFELESVRAHEGYELDRSILVKARNAALAERRKQQDNYTCQACGFRLQVGSGFVIEVHHKDPLSVTGDTDTSIQELVSLCPTCHRIAHMRSLPYTVEEIRGLLLAMRVSGREHR